MFEEMSDEELSTWYKEFLEQAANPAADDHQFSAAHDAPRVTLRTLRAKLRTFDPDTDPGHDEGSPMHNLWHWIHGPEHRVPGT